MTRFVPYHGPADDMNVSPSLHQIKWNYSELALRQEIQKGLEYKNKTP